MRIHKRIEHFEKCFRCQKTDTKEIATNLDDMNGIIVFCGWCSNCDREYSYQERVDTVYDKQNRI